MKGQLEHYIIEPIRKPNKVTGFELFGREFDKVTLLIDLANDFPESRM